MKRSRRKLEPGTVCYLCGKVIEADEAWDRDHVPPLRFYGKSIRTRHNPQLDWLPTHVGCNSAYKADEELFCTAFAMQAQGSYTGDAVIEDLRRGFQQGHFAGLGQAVLDMYGRVALADGSIMFRYDVDRTLRFIWKLACGVYRLNTGRTVPNLIGHAVSPPFLGSESEKRRVSPDWYAAVHNTESMGRDGMVLDYRWIGWSDHEHGIRGNAMILLLWDRIVCPVLFHDPTCGCKGCSGAPD